MGELRNSFLPARDATWNMRSKATLVARVWRTLWPSFMWDPELFGGRRSPLSLLTAGPLFSTLSLTPAVPAPRILQPTCLANDHKFLLTTFGSLEQKVESPAVRKGASGRPQFPRDCLWGPRVGYVSTHESWPGSGLQAWRGRQTPCVRGPPTALADPGICLLIGSCVLGGMSHSGECP